MGRSERTMIRPRHLPTGKTSAGTEANPKDTNEIHDLDLGARIRTRKRASDIVETDLDQSPRKNTMTRKVNQEKKRKSGKSTQKRKGTTRTTDIGMKDRNRTIGGKRRRRIGEKKGKGR